MRPIDTIGGLSNTSKMPWLSWSIDADECPNGSRLKHVPGSVCAICYAQRNMYRMPNVRDAMARRLDALRAALSSSEARAEFVHAFATVLNDKAERIAPAKRFFRWFDSGDFQNVEHVSIVSDIARRTPDVSHYVPTKQYADVRSYCSSRTLPDNLVIRLSAPMIDGPPAKGPADAHVQHTVTYRDAAPADVKLCKTTPNKRNQPTCGTCRACWDPTIETIAYPAK